MSYQKSVLCSRCGKESTQARRTGKEWECLDCIRTDADPVRQWKALAARLAEALQAIDGCIAHCDTTGEWVLSGRFRTLPALTQVREALADYIAAATKGNP